MPVLLPDDVENGLLDVEQAELYALHVLQLIHRLPLHLDLLVVAVPVVEGVGTLGEVVHHVVRAQDGDPGRVVPRDGQGVLGELVVAQHDGGGHGGKLRPDFFIFET